MRSKPVPCLGAPTSRPDVLPRVGPSEEEVLTQHLAANLPSYIESIGSTGASLASELLKAPVKNVDPRYIWMAHAWGLIRLSRTIGEYGATPVSGVRRWRMPIDSTDCVSTILHAGFIWVGGSSIALSVTHHTQDATDQAPVFSRTPADQPLQFDECY